MIFVTVGTHIQQFNRLVKAADELAGLLNEEVVIQRGISDHSPRNARFFDFAPLSEMEDLVSCSRVVIAQAGAGTVITVSKYNKPLILVPRREEYEENYNNHQLELANALQNENRAVCISEPSGQTLLQAIDVARSLTQIASQNQPQLIKAIKDQLRLWDY